MDCANFTFIGNDLTAFARLLPILEGQEYTGRRSRRWISRLVDTLNKGYVDTDKLESGKLYGSEALRLGLVHGMRSDHLR